MQFELLEPKRHNRSVFDCGDSVLNRYLQQFAPALQVALSDNVFAGWYLQTSGDKWQHAISNDFELLVPGSIHSLEQVAFVKLVKKIPLQEWDKVDELLLNAYAHILQVLYAPIR